MAQQTWKLLFKSIEDKFFGNLIKPVHHDQRHITQDIDN